MPVCIVLYVRLVIHIVLYPYSNRMLQEFNCSSCIIKNTITSFPGLTVKDPKMEKLENVLAEGLPQFNHRHVSLFPFQLPLSSCCTHYLWSLLLGLMYILSYLKTASLQFRIH